MHSCFLWRSIALSFVAGKARKDAVFPVEASTSTPRLDVIDREFFGTWSAPTILTGVPVAAIQIQSGEGDGLIANSAVISQDDDFEWGECEFGASDEEVFGRILAGKFFTSRCAVPGDEIMDFIAVRVDDLG